MRLDDHDPCDMKPAKLQMCAPAGLSHTPNLCVWDAILNAYKYPCSFCNPFSNDTRSITHLPSPRRHGPASMKLASVQHLMRLIRSFPAKPTRSMPFPSWLRPSSESRLLVPVREMWSSVVLSFGPGLLRVSSYSVCMRYAGPTNAHPRHGLVAIGPDCHSTELSNTQHNEDGI